ncbi:MAG TPA: hypothetical protein VFQ80_18710 [Thermomicrobiales bacterium]|jgi:hypothetical protein|nr:hypothetical protein [Thermomicrobiales bacterium]
MPGKILTPAEGRRMLREMGVDPDLPMAVVWQPPTGLFKPAPPVSPPASPAETDVAAATPPELSPNAATSDDR